MIKCSQCENDATYGYLWPLSGDRKRMCSSCFKQVQCDHSFNRYDVCIKCGKNGEESLIENLNARSPENCDAAARFNITGGQGGRA